MFNPGNIFALRWISPFVLAGGLAVLFWLTPSLSPESMGASTPDGGIRIAVGFFVIAYMYLVIQGYPVAHEKIGSSSAHNWDNMVSSVPGVAAVVGFVLDLTNLWPLSGLVMTICIVVALTVVYDLWILGGCAARVNRLTDEIKSEQ